MQVHEPMSCRRGWNEHGRTVCAYSRSRRSGAAAALRATRIADGLPVVDAGGGEEIPERKVGPRRPHLSDAQRQAARINQCLHQKFSIHRAARALQDRKPADARDPQVRANLHAAQPAGTPAAPLDAAEPTLQLTREAVQEVVCIVSDHHRQGCRVGRLR